MKPIYFPFTYISKSVCNTLAVCFPQTAVYQISRTKIPEDMQELSQKGLLDIRIPLEVDSEFFDKVLKDYRAWVNLHQGTETSYLATMANQIPFFDKSASSQIRADLKNIGKQIHAEKKPDPLFHVKLFLHMAQEYDRQKEELNQDLMDIEAVEYDFMKDLKWEDDDDHARAVARKKLEKDDPGHFMTTERLKAWISLMLKDPQGSALFTTTSRAVMEHLMDIMPEMEQVIRFNAVTMGVDEDKTLSNWRNDLLETLKKLALENWPVPMEDLSHLTEISGMKRNAALTIYIVPNKSPQDCFADYVESDAHLDEPAKTELRFKNTLIGFIEKNG
jgi:hypothetical protein